MAVTQTALLAQADTEATSAVVTVDANVVVGIGLFVASGNIPSGEVRILVKTPGANQPYSDGDQDGDENSDVRLSAKRSSVQIVGPIEVYIYRPAGMNVGVYKNA